MQCLMKLSIKDVVVAKNTLCYNRLIKFIMRHLKSRDQHNFCVLYYTFRIYQTKQIKDCKIFQRAC